jgi:hypothetical protein
MSRASTIIWIVLLSLAVPAALLYLAGRQAAAQEARIWGDPHVGIVADTSSSMQPELDGLALGWSKVITIEIPPPLTATFHLATFKDESAYLGSTQDREQFGNWLDSLTAEGGAGCPTGALGGLLTLARNLPENGLTDSNALLVTDATPKGNRQAYAYMVDKMLRRGIRVHAVLSGWCPNAPLPESALAYLAMATGGRAYSPTMASDYVTDTQIALSVMSASDLLASRAGFVTAEQPQIVPLAIDSTITTLGVEETDPNAECPPWCCLTCTVGPPDIPALDIDVTPGVQVVLRDPDGQVVGPGTPGYSLIESTSHALQFNRPLTEPLKSGLWALHVSGDGAYDLRVIANSSLHLAYLGRHTLPLGHLVPVRAALSDGSGMREPLTATFSLVSLNGQQVQSIELFDDGQHGDNMAGDGIFGGPVLPAAVGLWRLAVHGRLDDGTPFRRIDPAPIRVQRINMADPPSRDVLPGDSRSVTFVLEGSNAAADGPPTVYDLAVFSSQGWSITDTVPVSIALAEGESASFTVEVNIPADAPIGAIEETTLVAVPVGDLGGGLSAVSETVVVDKLKSFVPLVMK